LAALVAVDPAAIQRLASLMKDIEDQTAQVEEMVRRVVEAVRFKDLLAAQGVAGIALREVGYIACLARQAAFHAVETPKPPKRRSRKV
jgi:hypothetical protein